MLTLIHFYPRSPCGERPQVCQVVSAELYFYPRSPCGERQEKNNGHDTASNISIHALLAESDLCPSFMPSQILLFLSTLSLRRATCGHFTGVSAYRYFYPRSPCGERQPWGPRPQPPKAISIHALLAESDKPIPRIAKSIFKFLSTLSLRRATSISLNTQQRHNPFLSTLSLRRATSEALH